MCLNEVDEVKFGSRTVFVVIYNLLRFVALLFFDLELFYSHDSVFPLRFLLCIFHSCDGNQFD